MTPRLSPKTLVVLLAVALASACGGNDGGRDASVSLSDTGGAVDTGTMPVDTGMRADTGMSGRMCSEGGACDVIAQNCPMTTDGCYYAMPPSGGMATTMCVAAGTGGDGAPCMYVNECLPGFSCNDGVCRRYCCMGATSDCPPGQICIGIGGTMLGQCTDDADCTLVPNGGCMMGQGCYPISADGTLGCVNAGTLREGEPCRFLNDCMPGAGCFGPSDGMGQCARFCRMGMAEADCGSGRMCVRAGGAPEGIGICQGA